jgi:hypothetical protein
VFLYTEEIKMKLLSSEALNQVSGGMATMSGGFSMGPNGFTFGPNFVITVTDNSANILGSLKAYANQVVDGSTGAVLFDGTQSSFCFKDSSFSVTAVPGGHSYHYAGACIC